MILVDGDDRVGVGIVCLSWVSFSVLGCRVRVLGKLFVNCILIIVFLGYYIMLVVFWVV